MSTKGYARESSIGFTLESLQPLGLNEDFECCFINRLQKTTFAPCFMMATCLMFALDCFLSFVFLFTTFENNCNIFFSMFSLV